MANDETFGQEAAAVLACVPVALLVVADDGRVRHLNPEAERLFGWTASEASSKSLADLLAPAPGLPRGADLRALEAPRARVDPAFGPGFEAVGTRRDGSTFPVVFTSQRSDDTGAAVLVVRDATTYQREASTRRATDERVRRLLESARVIPWEADVATTQFTYVGPQATEILGYPVSDWYTHDFWPLHIHPEDRDHAMRLCAAATARETHYEFEYRMLAADGRVVWIHDIVVVDRWRGVPQLISGYMLEITGRKEAEEERERLLVQTRGALRMRDDFLSLAAHELRTPLTPAGLKMQLVKRLLEKGHADARLVAAVDAALDQLGHLAELTDDLLDVTRITQGRIELRREPVDLSRLTRDVVTTFKDAFEAAGCVATIDAPRPVEGHWDRARVEQMVSILLSNAVRYGTGKPIEVRVSDDAKLSVRDHGIGLAAEDQERVFERFERAVPLTRYPGLGVGLYVARELVRAHGGSIHVESTPGEGATFTIELPP